MSGIGGLNAFIKPLVNSIVPYFVVYFLYSLAKILVFKYEQCFHVEAISFLNYSKNLLYKRVADQENQEYKQVIHDIDDCIDHELNEQRKLSDKTYKEEESKSKVQNDMDDDQRDLEFLEVLITRISKLLDSTH